MAAKRILHIIPTLDRAGAEKQLVLLVRGLPADAFDVHVCALTRGGPLLDDLAAAGIPATVLGKRWKLDPPAWFRLRRFIAGLKPDLVHTWIFAANSYGRSAAFSCGVKRVVASERCVDPWKDWWELAIDRYLARRTDRIVVNSPGVREFYAGRGLPAEKMLVIPNGVPAPDPPAASREEILAELGLPLGTRMLGLVGRLWPQKGVKDAIWAADLLKRVRDDAHLLVIGEGPYGRALRRFRDCVEIADRVHFLGHRDDVPRLMPHFDVLWNTSLYEGQSNSIMEAMALGVPVVASDIPGNRDLVAPGETGYLVPAGTSGRAALAKHTNDLLSDAALLRRLGDAARRRVEHEFSVVGMVGRYVELYHQLLD